MPDDQLFALQRMEVSEEEVLEREFERMLADEKSDRFADQFVPSGSTWTGSTGLPSTPDTTRNSIVPQDGHDGETRSSEILAAIFRSQFIDADFTMLNASLAKRYGLEGPKSQRFERVSLKDGQAGRGIEACIDSTFRLDGADSHPIKRAVWIENACFTTHPNPPRSGIEQSVDDFGFRSANNRGSPQKGSLWLPSQY